MRILLLITTLIMATLLATQACKNDQTSENMTQSENGELPVYYIGDKWIYSNNTGNGEMPVTIEVEVVGEGYINGKKCYVIHNSITPHSGTLVESISYVNQSNLDEIRHTKSGANQMGEFVAEIEYQYDRSNPRFPLQIGKTWECLVTETTNIDWVESSETNYYTQREYYKSIVACLETVHVQAGTFDCYKIDEYNQDNEITYSMWYSDYLKANVKSIDLETGQTTELLSFSLN